MAVRDGACTRGSSSPTQLTVGSAKKRRPGTRSQAPIGDLESTPVRPALASSVGWPSSCSAARFDWVSLFHPRPPASWLHPSTASPACGG